MSKETTQIPGPTELYILAAGLLLGILLGPAVLGRLAPTAHATLFGGGPATQQLLDYEKETAAMIATLEATGVTPDAIGEQLELRALQGDMIKQGRDSLMDVRAFGYILLVLLALTLWLVAQAVSTKTRALWTIITYSLVAMALAVILARPNMLSQSLLWPWA